MWGNNAVEGSVDNRLPGKSVVKRRKVLSIGGMVASGILAGCTGGSDDAPTEDGQSGDGESGSDQTETEQPEQTEDEIDFPSRDITIIVHYGPGGGYDTYARLVGKHMTKYTPDGVNVRVENVTGGGGRVGTNRVYNADPDGYTTLMFNPDSMIVEQVIQGAEYDVREMTWLPRVAGRDVGLAVGTNTDIESFDDYVNAVSNNEVRFGTEGILQLETFYPILLGELGGLYNRNRVIDNAVFYDQGTSQIVTAISRGDVQAFAASYSSLLPFVKSGDLRIILVGTFEDGPPSDTPDAETLATATPEIENARKIFDLAGGTYHRVFGGPPDVPQARLDIQEELFTKTINDEEFLAEAAEADRPVSYAPGDEVRDAVISKYESTVAEKALYEELLEE